MRIGIVGCGIAGQASAITLARLGHEITIVERFSEIRPLGAGLLLQPSGQEVLKRLGLLDLALSWGERIARLSGKTTNGRMVMDLRYADFAAGAFGLGIHRTVLFEILHHALRRTSAKIILGFDVIDIEAWDRPRLLARDGRSEGPFDLILDCAGAHDRLREAFARSCAADLNEWGALWTTCADTTGSFSGQLHQVYRGADTMIGILPVGRVPDTPDKSQVAFFWSLKRADFEQLRAEGLDSLKARIVALWPDAAPIVGDIAAFESLSLATYRNVKLKPWHRGRVVALGDAAHGTSPQLGQGANLALIDAFIIAHAIKTSSGADGAISKFSRLRRPHVRFYQLASRMLTPFFQSDSRVLGFARDMMLGPAGRLPLVDHVMRTTLAGVRKFPLGTWRLPASSVEESAASERDGGDVAEIETQKDDAVSARQSPAG